MVENKGIPEKEPYCFAPWIGLHITTGSNINHHVQKERNKNHIYSAPCCAWQGKFYNGPIEELYGEYWKKIKQNMLNYDIESLKESCIECIMREKSGLESDREHITKKVKSSTYSPGELNWLDYRPNNTCNLRCRMCSAENSSLVAKDENIEIPISKDDDIYKLNFSKLKILKILGGEPTIQKEAYNFIKYVSENCDTNEITLQYTSNMAVCNDKWLNLLKNFKNVYCEMSIDGTGKVFEYMRQGSKWKIVEKNINKLYYFSKNNSFQGFKLKFHITVGAILMVTVEDWLPWFIENSHIDADFYPIGGIKGGPISILENKDKEKIKNYLKNIDHIYAKHLLSLLYAEDFSSKILGEFKKVNTVKDKLYNTDINQFNQIKELNWF